MTYVAANGDEGEIGNAKGEAFMYRNDISWMCVLLLWASVGWSLGTRGKTRSVLVLATHPCQ